ncbi:MAG TPA: hypothetical protein VD963_03375 [Phycisphaerales bacterium]|nr:hypothetical protein [Phycisphaerales bacterium]
MTPRAALRLLLALLLVAAAPPPARAQGGLGALARHPEDRAEVRRLVKDSEAARDAGAYAEAETLTRRLVELNDANFVHWYNLACYQALQGKTEEAGQSLTRAIERGFSDLRQLTTDPDLESLRGTRTYRDLVAGWDAIDDTRVEARLRSARERFGGRYHYERDADLRIAYVSAYSKRDFEAAKGDLRQCAAWWRAHVAAEAPLPPSAPRTPPWVLVMLPTTDDYAQWATEKFGAAWQQIGGSYDDDQKTLWAMDVGPTLRHEFWHVLHWRDMRARGQMHPPWVMEGLCSLVEDARVGPAGEMVVLPSWRTNIAKRLSRAGRLPPWEQLFGVPHDRFVKTRPLAQYAQARAVFEFLAERGKLAAWYAAYVQGFTDDPTGRAALEEVFGLPLKDIEKQYVAWLRARPDGDEDGGRSNKPLTPVSGPTVSRPK